MSGLGPEIKDAHEMARRETGQTFTIERSTLSFPARGMLNRKESYVSFAAETDVEVGDVLRSIDKRTLFYVVEVTSYVVDDTVVDLRAHYETDIQRARQQAAARSGGDTYNFHGTVQNSIVGNQQTANLFIHATQQLGQLPEDDRAALTDLVAQLQTLVQQVPESHRAEASTLARRVDAVITEVGAEQPDKEVVGVSLNGLKKAAENIAKVMPTILPVAMQIVERLQHHS